jgi:hypothetical protein
MKLETMKSLEPNQSYVAVHCCQCQALAPQLHFHHMLLSPSAGSVELAAIDVEIFAGSPDPESRTHQANNTLLQVLLGFLRVAVDASVIVADFQDER